MNRPLKLENIRTITLNGGPNHGQDFEVTRNPDLLDLPLNSWWSTTWSRYNVYDTHGVYVGEVQ